jgi:hypothetical protein
LQQAAKKFDKRGWLMESLGVGQEPSFRTGSEEAITTNEDVLILDLRFLIKEIEMNKQQNNQGESDEQERG